MAPNIALFLIYPLSAIVIAATFKIVFRGSSKANGWIILLIYILSNLGIYLFVEGAFAKGPLIKELLKLGLFTDLKFRQWIDIFLVPNTFTFLYIGISFLFLWGYDRIQAEARKIRMKHDRLSHSKKEAL